MSLFKAGVGRWRIPVRVAEPMPRDIVDAADEVMVEYRARTKHAMWLVDRALAEQSELEHADRDIELVDLCLGVRSALRPGRVEATVLRELPSVTLRHSVPVIPGRS